MVYFVGAGAGDPELLTVKGKRLIDNADTIIYAGSLVNPAVLADRRPDCQVYDSAGMTLEEVLAVMQETEAQGKTTVRVHTGDASIYGAIREQLDALDKLGIPHSGAGVVRFWLRLRQCKGIHPAGRDTDGDPHPHGGQNTGSGTGTAGRTGEAPCTMIIFLRWTYCGAGGTAADCLSGSHTGGSGVQGKLAGGKIVTGTLLDIAEKVQAAGITKTALVTVGEFLGDAHALSKLYDKTFTHEFERVPKHENGVFLADTAGETAGRTIAGTLRRHGGTKGRFCRSSAAGVCRL
ncbi:MAG: cobalt-precorrin-4/precorrin-4 C(11)-methyltransferase [Ruminococcus callidus]